MSEQTPPLNPFWLRPLMSDPGRVKRLAKKAQAMAPKPKDAPKQPTDEERQEQLGLACPQCGCNASEVTATRPAILKKVWRRRECMHCGHKFTTFERVVGKPKSATNSTRPKKSG